MEQETILKPLTILHSFERFVHQRSKRVERRFRRVSSFLVLYLSLQAELGLAWDRNWHDYLGRDQFWILPHILIYTGLGGAGLVALIVVLVDSVRYAGRKLGVDETSTIPILRIFHAPLGFVIIGWGTFVDLAAAPLDNYWHELYGIDVTLWSPFHIMGTIGGLLAGIGILYIFASEAAIERDRIDTVPSNRWFPGLSAPDWGALIIFAAFLELTLPALTAFVPFMLGTWQFVSYPLPLACAAGFCLVGSVQLTRQPGSATLTAMILWIAALLTQGFVPYALRFAESWYDLSLRPGVEVPVFNVTLALLPATFLIDAILIDGIYFWQRRQHRLRDAPLRGSWLPGALIALPLMFFPVLLVMGLSHLGIPIPLQKDIVLAFSIEPTINNMLLTLPLALVVGAGGALLGSALGDIWYWSKR